jgi:hypothetical protein
MLPARGRSALEDAVQVERSRFISQEELHTGTLGAGKAEDWLEVLLEQISV